MVLSADLLSGARGFSLALPTTATIRRDDAEFLEAVDDATGLTWMVFVAPRSPLVVPLDDVGLAAFTRRADIYARDMFASTAATINKDDPDFVARTARGDDWTPLVEVERLDVADGIPALRTVHRMAYQQGLELVMGHLLVPLADNVLLEVRVSGRGRQQMTGYRESALLVLAGTKGFLSQAAYDDPQHDDRFVDHPLSLVRAALRETAATLRVSKPALSSRDRLTVTLARHEITLVSAGFAIVVDVDDTHAVLDRVAFCVTDGRERVLVGAHGPSTPATLQRDVERHARTENAGLEIQLTPAATHVDVVVTGSGRFGAIRNQGRWFIDEHGTLWSLTAVGNGVVGDDAGFAELTTMLAGYRATPRAAGLWERLKSAFR